ncbi:hypothetical protein MMC19_000779 [Ptychographa xylographoides]|nr:hypothetical protein [Ptychographa xylographoides]
MRNIALQSSSRSLVPFKIGQAQGSHLMATAFYTPEPSVENSRYLGIPPAFTPGVYPTRETMSSNGTQSSSPVLEPKSVKHLTCFYWHKYGKCNKSDDECLYAHKLTGSFADEPRHVEPGRPAVAGRNARSQHPVYHNWRTGSPACVDETPSPQDRFVTPPSQPGSNLHVDERSSSSAVDLAHRFSSMTVSQPNTVPYHTYQRTVQTLRELVDLQTNMAKTSQDRFSSVVKGMKGCRETLSASTSTLTSNDSTLQSHAELVEAVIEEFEVMEQKLQSLSDKMKTVSIEVAREMEKLRSSGAK